MAKARLAAKRLKLDQDQQEKKLDGAIAQLAATNGPRSPRATNKNEGKASGAASGRCFPGGGLRTLYKYTNLSLLSAEPPERAFLGRLGRPQRYGAVGAARQKPSRADADARVDKIVARPQAVDAARSHARSTPSTQRIRRSSRPVWWGRAAQHQRLRLLHLCHADPGRRGRVEAGDLGGGVDVLARAPAAEVFLEMMNVGALLM